MNEALFGGLSGLGASLISGGFSMANNAINRKHQQQMYERQRSDAVEDRDISMNFQRELLDYNSAENQVKRLQEAGLNPATAFGGNSAATPNQTANVNTRGAAAPMPAQRSNPADALASFIGTLPNILEAKAAGKNADSNASMAESQSFKVQQDAITQAYNRRILDRQEAQMLLDYNFAEQTFETRKATMTEELNKLKSETSLADAKTEEAKSLVQLNDAKINEINSIITLNMERAEQVRQDTSLTPFRKQQILADIQFKQAMALNSQKDAALKEVMTLRENVLKFIDENQAQSKIDKAAAEAKIAEFEQQVQSVRFSIEQAVQWAKVNKDLFDANPSILKKYSLFGTSQKYLGDFSALKR